ncbi:UPF0158 family protein [Micromonospora sp. NPDC047548]|uniref:UPF0158 family protein n=1 Tax=Micromonospora sp. NPDC047548 TaxID=3155624 RepID=UPI0033ED7AFB
MLEISDLDLDEIVMALQSQDGYEQFWLIDPATGEITFASRDLDPDLDLDDSDLIRIDPLPSRVWYRDMADFADGIADERVGRRLARAIQGRGAFRRFKDELHAEHPHLLQLWYEFSGRRGVRRAVEWLADSSLVDVAHAYRFLADHPDIDLSETTRTARRADAPVPPEKLRWSDAELDALIEAATVDAYNDDERLTGLYAALEEHLVLPFTAEVLGVAVSVDRIDLADDGRIVAVCERDGARQPIGVLDLPLPDPAPKGSQWIAAYRRWIRR